MDPKEIREEIKLLLDSFTPDQQEKIIRLLRLALSYPVTAAPQ